MLPKRSQNDGGTVFVVYLTAEQARMCNGHNQMGTCSVFESPQQELVTKRGVYNVVGDYSYHCVGRRYIRIVAVIYNYINIDVCGLRQCHVHGSRS